MKWFNKSAILYNIIRNKMEKSSCHTSIKKLQEHLNWFVFSRFFSCGREMA
jgi:hypothetical protein